MVAPRRILTLTATDEGYTYDANGNRQTTQDETVETDSHNRVISRTNASTNTVVTYEYDAEGNRTAETETVNGSVQSRILYDWDHRNQLVKRELLFGGTITFATHWFAYDAFGNRAAKFFRPNSAGDPDTARSTYYVYQGDDIARTYFDLDGTANPGLPDSTSYLHGPSIDDVLAQDASAGSGSGGGDVLWALPDHLGSVRDVVEESATPGAYAVANHVVYDAFGGRASETDPTVAFRYGFAGRELDEATGLYHNRARYYDPATGTFISPDPSGFSGGDANLYRYTGNAPTFRTDPTGLAWTGGAAVYNTFFNNTITPAPAPGGSSPSHAGLSMGLGAIDGLQSSGYDPASAPAFTNPIQSLSDRDYYRQVFGFDFSSQATPARSAADAGFSQYLVPDGGYFTIKYDASRLSEASPLYGVPGEAVFNPTYRVDTEAIRRDLSGDVSDQFDAVVRRIGRAGVDRHLATFKALAGERVDGLGTNGIRKSDAFRAFVVVASELGQSYDAIRALAPDRGDVDAIRAQRISLDYALQADSEARSLDRLLPGLNRDQRAALSKAVDDSFIYQRGLDTFSAGDFGSGARLLDQHARLTTGLFASEASGLSYRAGRFSDAFRIRYDGLAGKLDASHDAFIDQLHENYRLAEADRRQALYRLLEGAAVTGGAVAGGLIGSLAGPAGTLGGGYVGGAVVAGAFGTADRLESGRGWGASLAGGYFDGSGAGYLYTAATGDIALNGIDDRLGTGQRVLAGVGGVLALAPLAPFAPAAVRGAAAGGRALGAGARMLAPRLNPLHYTLEIDTRYVRFGTLGGGGSVHLKYNAPAPRGTAPVDNLIAAAPTRGFGIGANSRVSGPFYVVGPYSQIRRGSLQYVAEANHVPQTSYARRLFGAWDDTAGTEITIRLPYGEHQAVSAAQASRRFLFGSEPASARQLLGQDIRILRQYTNAPHEKLREIIREVRRLHPEDINIRP